MSIEIKDLSFSYGKHQVLHDINLSIPDSTLVNVLGPNGVGKSTLFRCILGLNGNYEGDIIVNGKNLRDLSIKERAREISYIPQSHAPIYDYEVLDVVLMSTGADLGMMRTPGPRHRKRAFRALERIGIEHLAHRTYTQISGGEQQLTLIARAIAQDAKTIIMDEPTSALDYGNTVRVLSCVRQLAREGGEQQLTLIARAIAQDAKTIIMDEPTSALDYGNTVRVLSCVRQLAREGLSIVQSTHQPDQAFLYSDKTLVINKGRVFAFGDPKDVITKELVSDLYGVDVEVNSLYGDKVRVCVPVKEIAR